MIWSKSLNLHGNGIRKLKAFKMSNDLVKVDVRVIVSGAKVAEIVSKSINQMNLEEDYNIIISSIIPTSNIEIAKKVATGADIILIGSYGHDEHYNLLYNELKTDFNHIGLFDYNNIIIEDESIDEALTKEEIFNSIIKSGLSYSLNIINIHALENKLNELNNEYNLLKDEFDKLKEENNALTLENLSQSETITKLNNNLDGLKSDFSSFKLRYEDISSKNILEVYSLKDLWADCFGEELTSEDKVIVASENFRPENIIVGQGLIAAQSREDAIDWLKIIKTALIFLENNEEDLKENLNNYSEDNNKNDDYEVPNAFENFWE